MQNVLLLQVALQPLLHQFLHQNTSDLPFIFIMISEVDISLFNLEYSISYSELRRFLTSAAEHGMNSQRDTPSGGIVPSLIAHQSQGGELIVAVADNWDHNEP
ncbi:hypothetical protein DPMN_156721 [Dreissena polymorpha]|uniref:Uncharacterized protein n=1 Tax=Dreissena polymorpha TaxID=45954 RepID=A0A9D4FTN5_DREPO|nr:hypothetical protein DPMN_156721 [Dreissena polymorpha]